MEVAVEGDNGRKRPAWHEVAHQQTMLALHVGDDDVALAKDGPVEQQRPEIRRIERQRVVEAVGCGVENDSDWN